MTTSTSRSARHPQKPPPRIRLRRSLYILDGTWSGTESASPASNNGSSASPSTSAVAVTFGPAWAAPTARAIASTTFSGRLHFMITSSGIESYEDRDHRQLVELAQRKGGRDAAKSAAAGSRSQSQGLASAACGDHELNVTPAGCETLREDATSGARTRTGDLGFMNPTL